MPTLKHFTPSEFYCKCPECNSSKHVNMDHYFLYLLDELRELCGFPFVITSGYRCKNHPVEKAKSTPGVHNKRIAADIQVSSGAQRRAIVEGALRLGFNGIGVHEQFVHVDLRDRPTMWMY